MTSIWHGFVLFERDHGETDRVYTLYTRERGRVRVMAKGTRKFLSKLAPHLSLFTELRFMVAQGRAWYKLASVERLHDHPRLRTELSTHGLALAVNELFHVALGDQSPDVALYTFLGDVYAWIETLPVLSPDRYLFVQSALVLKGLVLLGFGPHMAACVGCHSAVADVARPAVSVSHGGLVCGDCRDRDTTIFADAIPQTQEQVAALRFLAEAPFEELLNSGVSPVLASLTDIQDRFVQYHLERELRVPTFLNVLTVSYANNHS